MQYCSCGFPQHLQVYGEDAVDDNTCHHWFGDGSCKDQPCSGRPSLVSEENVDQAITNDPHLTIQELGETLGLVRSMG